MYQYTVKFWFTNKEGFKQQGEEVFLFGGKGYHKPAEALCIKKWRKAPYNQAITIISVICD